MQPELMQIWVDYQWWLEMDIRGAWATQAELDHAQKLLNGAALTVGVTPMELAELLRHHEDVRARPDCAES